MIRGNSGIYAAKSHDPSVMAPPSAPNFLAPRELHRAIGQQHLAGY